MTTQTQPTDFPFTLNPARLHDQLDVMRAQLRQMAQANQTIGQAFEHGHLVEALRHTDLGQRYLTLTRRADWLARLPDRRTALTWAAFGSSLAWLIHRRGWDKRALTAASRAAYSLRRRLPRRPSTTPAHFAVSPASAAVFDLARSGQAARVFVPAPDGHTRERSGPLILLGDAYFAVLVGEMPYLFLPDQIADVQLAIAANGRHTALITLSEAPCFDTDLS